MIAYLKKQYYRYTLVSGVCVLTTAETVVVHGLVIMSLLFFIRYTWSFILELLRFFSSKEFQEL